jgi:hypothetical protein
MCARAHERSFRSCRCRGVRCDYGRRLRGPHEGEDGRDGHLEGDRERQSEPDHEATLGNLFRYVLSDGSYPFTCGEHLLEGLSPIDGTHRVARAQRATSAAGSGFRSEEAGETVERAERLDWQTQARRASERTVRPVSNRLDIASGLRPAALIRWYTVVVANLDRPFRKCLILRCFWRFRWRRLGIPLSPPAPSERTCHPTFSNLAVRRTTRASIQALGDCLSHRARSCLAMVASTSRFGVAESLRHHGSIDEAAEKPTARA